MTHAIYRITSVNVIADYTLHIQFDDQTEQTINLKPILAGELYGPLKDKSLFNQVVIDPEVHTLVWPNGADFDPAILHDWPQHSETLIKQIAQWNKVSA